MKICLTVHSSPWSSFKGGGQLAVHHLAQQLALMGQQVWVIYSMENTLNNLTPDVAYSIIRVNHIDVKTLNFNAISIARAVYKLGKEVELDIIHGNGEEAFFLPWVANILKTKFVCTSHAPTIVDRGFFPSLGHPIQLLKELNLHLFRSAIKRSDCIITYSKYSHNTVQKALDNYPKEKIFQITPGVHHSWLDAVRDDNQEEQRSITFFGRIEYEKGVDVLISAFKKARERYPQCVLNIVGEGNWEKNAQRLAKSLRLEGKVIFHGWKELPDLQRIVRRSTLCVLPSRIESFGLTIVEAMSSGIPLITTKSGAIPEKVHHGETALLVSSEDSTELIAAIMYAFEHPSEMESMGKRAREEARRFSYATTALQQIEIYKSLVRDS